MTLPPRRVLVVSAAVASTLPGDTLLYTVLPVLWEPLGLELWMVGVLLSVNRFVRLATNPLAGVVVERTGMHGPFTVATFASVLVTLCYAFAPGFALLLAARMVWGLLWSFLRLGGFLAALGSDLGRGHALGIYNGIASLGTLVAAVLGGWLTDSIGFRSTAILFATLAIPAGFALLRERPARDPHTLGEAAASRADDSSLGPDALRRWAIYAAAFATSAAGSPLVVATLGLWLADLFGESVSVGGVVLGIASLNGLLLGLRFGLAPFWMPAAGRLSDRLGRLPFAAISGAFAALGMLALSTRAGLGWTVAAAIGVFLAGIALRVSCDALAGDAAPPATRARFMSWYANASDLGAAAGPFFAYQVAGAFGVDAVYRAGAVALALSGAVVLVLLRHRPARS